MLALLFSLVHVSPILLVKLMVLSCQQGSQDQDEDTDEKGKSGAYGHTLGVARCIARIEYVCTQKWLSSYESAILSFSLKDWLTPHCPIMFKIITPVPRPVSVPWLSEAKRC